MADAIDADLRRRTWQLLQPGEIELDGLIAQTEYAGSQETRMHQATVEIGEVIAEHGGYEPGDTFVYSGTDDPEFASNQHQGLTLADEDFVWECQQLLREGSFDLVFYFEATATLDGLAADLRERGYTVTPVPGDEEPAEADVA